MYIRPLVILFIVTFFFQSDVQAIKYKVTDKEFIEQCYDWDVYQTNICPFPEELGHLCNDCRYDGEGKDQKNGNIIPNGSGNYSNIIIENIIPPNPNPSSEDDFDLQIFNTETQCLGDSDCNRYVRPRVPIISVGDIEPEPEVNENNRNVRTRAGSNIIKFEPPSQNWNFNNNYISYGLTRENASLELNRIHYRMYGIQRREVVNVKKDVFDDEGNIIGFNIETHKADTEKSTATFIITTEKGNTFTYTFNYIDLGRQGGSRRLWDSLDLSLFDKKEWSEEFLDGSPAASVALVERNVVKAGLLETNFHEIQNTVGQETVKVGEVETVKEVEIKVEKKDVKVPQNEEEVLIVMGAPSAKQKEFIINKDLFYPAKIATDALILNYNGEFKNGVPHGKGTVTILNPKINLKYGLYGDYKINLYGTFRDGVFKKLNEIYYPISGEVFKFTKGVKPYESEFTRNILHGACSGKCKKIKISLDNINLGKPSKKFKNMPAISSKLISETQLFKNNTPTILSTHATIEMEDNKGNILPTLGTNLPPLAKTSLFTLPGYNDFTSEDYININDKKTIKELKLNILNLKKTNLEKNVNIFLQNSAIKDRKELIKETKKISNKYKISPNRFLQKDFYEYLSNDKAHNNQPMTVNYAPIIKELAENKNKTGKFRKVGPDSLVGLGSFSISFSHDMPDSFSNNLLQEGYKLQIGDLITHSSGMDKKVKIESKPKKYEVDNNLLKKSQSGNIKKKTISSSYSSYLKSIAADPEVASRADSNLVGGNVITNVFGVLGFAEQVISLLNNSRIYGDLEFSTTMDIDYVLKSMIETNLPSNSSLDLEDEYVKKIFEISNVEKLALLLEIHFKNILDDPDSWLSTIFVVLRACDNSAFCNANDFIDLIEAADSMDYGGGSESMKKISKVVEASGQQQGGDGGGGQGESGGGESSGGGGW